MDSDLTDRRSQNWFSRAAVEYGIDDPNDNDVAAAGRLKHETYFANVRWDLNPTFRIGLEFAWRETEYRLLPNEGAGIHTQFQ